jgi:hypothetical protein
MTVYSFRAECPHDLEQLTIALQLRDVSCSIVATQGRGLPDCTAEIETEVALDIIRDVMRGVEDGHVMVQTLRACPLRDNSLERDFDREPTAGVPEPRQKLAARQTDNSLMQSRPHSDSAFASHDAASN